MQRPEILVICKPKFYPKHKKLLKNREISRKNLIVLGPKYILQNFYRNLRSPSY